MDVFQVLNEFGLDAGNDQIMAIFESKHLAEEWISEMIEVADLEDEEFKIVQKRLV